MITTINVRDECGADETLEIEVSEGQKIEHVARQAVEEWVRGGEWGIEGTEVIAWWSLEDSPDEEHKVVVQIEPDTEALIKQAVLDGASKYTYTEMVEKCGPDDACHDWTEGDAHSHGGTTMSFRSHCRRCGLYREILNRGWQRNPGEPIESVSYRWPTEDEMNYWREHGTLE